MATGGTGPYAYTWSATPAQNGTQLIGLSNGVYSVTVADAHYCMDAAAATVIYGNCCKPYIFNAFKPNGDGRNDKFHVLFKGDMKLLDLSIYDRFGQRIFNTSSSDQGWDGTWNNVPQDLGTYFYFIRLICGNHTEDVQEFKGDVPRFAKAIIGKRNALR